MNAVQSMTGQGGWPLSVFLTPDGRPFFGGTYFPDVSRHGLPSFRELLAGVDQAWRERRTEVEQAGAQLVEAMAAGRRLPTEAALPSTAILDEAVRNLETQFDAANGGWGRAPKFPQAMAIEFLLAATWGPATRGRSRWPAARSTGWPTAASTTTSGGGFARYATDAIWLVPHFEKMLYDNAQLARAYLHAFLVTDDPRYLEVALRHARLRAARDDD